jgi:transcriptional regulator with XRE-family HTH domain
MVRPPLTPEERARGVALGTRLRSARGPRSMADVAVSAGVPVETLRKIEAGRVPTPAFFTIVALADALRIPLAELARDCALPTPVG